MVAYHLTTSDMSLLGYLPPWLSVWNVLFVGLVAAVLSSAFAKLSQWTNARHDCGPAPFPPKATGMHDRYFQSRRTGLWIYNRTWTPAGSPKGVIYLIHGIGEHCGRYDHVANAMCKAGYVVHALDHQGHGQSHGTRCYFQQFSHLVDDIVQFMTSVKAPPAGVPAFILGHSMGGLVALHVARRPEIASKLQGLIISGPALIFDPEIDSPVNRFLAKTLSNVVPKMPVQNLDPTKLCTDKEIVIEYQRDPLLYTGGVRVRVGHEMIAAVDEALVFAHELKMPILIQHGERDIICGIEGSRKYIGLLTGSKDKKLVEYPDLFHEIFNETSFAHILRDTTQWLDAHVKA